MMTMMGADYMALVPEPELPQKFTDINDVRMSVAESLGAMILSYIHVLLHIIKLVVVMQIFAKNL